MKVKAKSALLVFLFAPLLLVTPVAANCGSVKTAVINCSGGGSGGPVISLLVTAVNFLAVGVGLAVVAGIIFGGFLYASAGSSAEQAKKGIGYVRNAVIALVTFIFMYALINFLVPGGLF